jgi:tRNA dimethylallyltransferase
VLISGISPMPEISAENRTKAMKLALEDFDKLCEIVYGDDPMLLERLSKDKHHQLIRAYEVMLETGRSIRVFQEQPRITFVPDIVPSIHKIEVPRAELYQRIERRFDKMLELGAIDEVKELLAELPDLSAPIYNAIGAREIARYLAGDLSFEEMHNTAILNSRHYAKRQITWLRTQLPY